MVLKIFITGWAKASGNCLIRFGRGSPWTMELVFLEALSILTTDSRVKVGRPPGIPPGWRASPFLVQAQLPLPEATNVAGNPWILIAPTAYPLEREVFVGYRDYFLF